MLGGSSKKVPRVAWSTTPQVQLWSRDGIYLGDLGEREDWIWSVAVRPRRVWGLSRRRGRCARSHVRPCEAMAMRPLRDEPLELLPAIVAVPHRAPRRRQGSPKRLPQLPLERNEVSFEAAMAKTVFELRRRRQSPRRRREPLTARQPQRPPELAGALRISFPAGAEGMGAWPVATSTGSSASASSQL